MSKKSSSARVNQEQVITHHEAVEAREAFDSQDPQHSGVVAVANLPAALQSMRLMAELEDVEKYLASVKQEGATSVTFDLFLSIVSKARATIVDHSELGIAFRLMDKSYDGVLTLDDLRKVVRELDEKFTEQDLREMIEEADTHSSGKVTFGDFEKIMREPRTKVK